MPFIPSLMAASFGVLSISGLVLGQGPPGSLPTHSTTSDVSTTTTSTDTFVPITAYSAYTAQSTCVQSCLSTAGFNDETDAAAQCSSLTEQFSQVSTCAISACGSIGTNLAYDAQTVLTGFCSSLESVTSLSISIPTPTLVGNAATNTDGLATASTAAGASTPLPGSGGSGVTSATSAGQASGTAASISASSASNSTTLSTTKDSKAGLTSSAKVGLGVGIGIGIPLIIGLIALAILMRRRRQSQSHNPYGPVLTSEKSGNKSLSYDSAPMHHHEAHPTSPETPFLPIPPPPQNLHSFQQQEEQQVPAYTATSPDPAVEEARRYPKIITSYSPTPTGSVTPVPQGRPATAAAVRLPDSPEPMQTNRPSTAPGFGRPRIGEEDEPPSPVSPVSPLTPAGSRPASLRGGIGGER